MVVGKGYDHNFVLDKTPGEGKLHMAARVEERQTGRVLEVETTEPGLQLYTGNFLDGSIRAKDENSSYDRHAGLCLETQHFPDSVNHTNFPSNHFSTGRSLHVRDGLQILRPKILGRLSCFGHDTKFASRARCRRLECGRIR